MGVSLSAEHARMYVHQERKFCQDEQWRVVLLIRRDSDLDKSVLEGVGLMKMMEGKNSELAAQHLEIEDSFPLHTLWNDSSIDPLPQPPSSTQRTVHCLHSSGHFRIHFRTHDGQIPRQCSSLPSVLCMHSTYHTLLSFLRKVTGQLQDRRIKRTVLRKRNEKYPYILCTTIDTCEVIIVIIMSLPTKLYHTTVHVQYIKLNFVKLTEELTFWRYFHMRE